MIVDDFKGHLMKPNSSLLSAIATAVVACGLSAAAGASVIEFSTRLFPSDGGTQSTAISYQTYIDNLMAAPPGAGYCDAGPLAWDGLANHSTCGSSVVNNIAFEISATFTVGGSEAGIWGIRVGPDFGFGGALFLDGVEIGFRTNDMWWNGSYTNSTQFFQWTGVLAQGTHVLEAYGLERCCDGLQQAQFSVANGLWTTFGVRDGHNPIPEPATLALLGLGLAGLGFARRR